MRLLSILFIVALAAPVMAQDAGPEEAPPAPAGLAAPSPAELAAPSPAADAAPDATAAATPVAAASPADSPAAGGSRSCVVLCYHHVDDPAKNEYTVGTAQFEQQLAHLKENGFAVVPLARVVDAYRGKGSLPPKAVAITIDDGWKCANTKALPLLKKYGFPATLFIYPAMVGSRGDKNTYEDYQQFAQDPLVTIACHSWSHPNLLKDGEKVKGAARDAWLQKEYVQSKLELQKRLGMPVKWLAYPYGLYDAQVAALVKEAGYEAAFSVNAAPNSSRADPMFLNRIMIMKSDGLKAFARKASSLPLELEGLEPADGATIPAGTRTISARVVDPNINPETVSLIMGKHRSTYDPTVRTATITLTGALAPKVYQIAAQARDSQTGRVRSASWLVRVKGVPAATARAARPEKAAKAAIHGAPPVRAKARPVEEDDDETEEE